MNGLLFHPRAFSLVWEMKPLTPEEHITAWLKLLAEWEKEKAAMKKPKGGGKKKC